MIRNRGNHSFSIFSDNSYFDLPQQLVVAPGLYEELLNGEQPYDSFVQDVRVRSFQSHTYTYFQHKLAGFYLKYKTGLFYFHKKMTSGLELNQENQEQRYAGEAFMNHLRMDEFRLYVEPAINYKNYRWDIQATLPVSMYSTHLDYRLPIDKRLRKTEILPTPFLHLKYAIDASWEVKAFSSLTY